MSHWNGGYSSGNYGVAGFYWSQAYKQLVREWETTYKQIVSQKCGTDVQLKESGLSYKFVIKTSAIGVITADTKQEDINLLIEELVSGVKTLLKEGEQVDWVNSQLAKLGKACGVATTPINQIMSHSKESMLEKAWLKQSKGIQLAFACKKANTRR